MHQRRDTFLFQVCNNGISPPLSPPPFLPIKAFSPFPPFHTVLLDTLKGQAPITHPQPHSNTPPNPMPRLKESVPKEVRASRKCGGGWYISSLERYGADQRASGVQARNGPHRTKPATTAPRAEPPSPQPPPLATPGSTLLVPNIPLVCDPFTVTPPAAQPETVVAPEGGAGVVSASIAVHTITARRKSQRFSLRNPPKEEKSAEAVRLQRLKAELRMNESMAPPDHQYKVATRDMMVRVLRNVAPGDLSSDSIRRLQNIGIDSSLLEQANLAAAAVSEITVRDVRLTGVSSYPLQVDFMRFMAPVAEVLEATAQGFAALFLRDEVLGCITTAFWFAFAAFFQKSDVPLFCEELDRMNDIHLRMFWEITSRRSRTKQGHAFYKVYHIAVAHVVCMAHIAHFKGSDKVLKKPWADRVYMLIFQLTTGMVHTEDSCAAFRDTYFPESLAKTALFPAPHSPRNARSTPPRPTSTQPRNREVMLGHPSATEAYEIGVYLPHGGLVDGVRAADNSIALMQRNCVFNLRRERFKFGRFPVDINLGNYEAEYNVFNSGVFDYDAALALRRAVESSEIRTTAEERNKEERRRFEVCEKKYDDAHPRPAQRASGFTLDTTTSVQPLASKLPTTFQPNTLPTPPDDQEPFSTHITPQSPRFDPFAFEMCKGSFREVIDGFKYELSPSVKKDGAKGAGLGLGFLGRLGHLTSLANRARDRSAGSLGMVVMGAAVAAQIASASFIDLRTISLRDRTGEHERIEQFASRITSASAPRLERIQHPTPQSRPPSAVTIATSPKTPSKTPPQTPPPMKRSGKPFTETSASIKRGAHAGVSAKSFLYETSPVVEAVVHGSSEVSKTWMMRTLSFGGRDTSSFEAAGLIHRRHVVRDELERDHLDKELRASIRTQNHLEQDLERIERLQSGAHSDTKKRSEFCDRLSQGTLKTCAMGRNTAHFKGTMLADAAANMASTLERGIRKLDQRLFRSAAKAKSRY